MAQPSKESKPSNEIKKTHTPADFAKFIGFSIVGIFAFFVPITINDTRTIPLDHMVTFFRETFPDLIPYYILIVILLGAVHPFINKSWNKNLVNIILTFFKLIGLLVALMLIFEFGPSWLFNDNMGPFLFNSLVTPVGVLLPIGAIFLALLVGYGLLEFIGIFLQPVMRPIWRTPGRSAIDAVASFVGSYALGLLITNRLYKEGKYNVKEATIIATGFSTVSVTFMVIIARTLDFMHIWNLYFWVTLIVTFLVTAITVRIWPIRGTIETYYEDNADPEEVIKENRFRVAVDEAIAAVKRAPSLHKNIWQNVRDGVLMAAATLPSILSVGLLGLVLAEFTVTFDILGYIFFPFTWIMQVPEPMLAAKAVSMEIAEMFLPALLVVEAPLVTKFIVGVVSVSAILFFSATIPVILSTDIPISVPKLIVIWIERTILTIIIVTPIAHLLL